jgi:hypothetical protein
VLAGEVAGRLGDGLELQERAEPADLVEVDPHRLPHEQVTALDHDDVDPDRGRQRRAQRSGVRDLHEPVARHALGRLVGALVGDQGRPAGILLAQLQPPCGDVEVGVALAQQALVPGTRGEGALERPGGVRVVRLELHVAARLRHGR